MKTQSDVKGKEFNSVFPFHLDYVRLGGPVLLEEIKKIKHQTAKQYQGT